MLNAEKHRDQLLKFVEENHDSLFGLNKNSEPISCAVSRCNNCQFGFKKNNYIEGYSCSAAKIKWLLSEYKEPVKLSRLEYEILKWAKKEGYKYITRDEDCELCTFQSEPEKLNIAWDCCDVYIELPLFKKLFQFIQWADEKPTSIQEMLNNCEVIDGESE